jgi:hypothetical protein
VGYVYVLKNRCLGSVNYLRGEKGTDLEFFGVGSAD